MRCSDILDFIRYESTRKRIILRIEQLYDLYSKLDDEAIKEEVLFKIRALEHKLDK
jgi:hypothetical protein